MSVIQFDIHLAKGMIVCKWLYYTHIWVTPGGAVCEMSVVVALLDVLVLEIKRNSFDSS